MPTIEVPTHQYLEGYDSESTTSLGDHRQQDHLAPMTSLFAEDPTEDIFEPYQPKSYWKFVRGIRVGRLDSFKIGLSMGTVLALSIATLWYALNPPIMGLPSYYVSAPIFYANFLFFFPILCWAAVLFFFERYSVPYHIVLGLKGRLITSIQVFKNALVLANLWLGSFFLFTLGTRNHLTLDLLGLYTIHVPSTIFTAVNYISLLIYIWPIRGFHRSSRRVLLKDLATILVGPFAVPFFRRTLVADITTSLVIPLRLFAEGTCLVVTGGLFTFTATKRQPICITLAPLLSDVVSVLPYLWRFLQCSSQTYRMPSHRQKLLPILNTCKYLTCIVAVAVSGTISVFEDAGMVTSAPVVAVKLGMVCCSTIYCYVWDVLCDWGLFTIDHGRIRFRELLYPSKIPYLIIPVTNIILRFAWALTLTPHGLWPYPQTLNLILGALELVRRFVWVAFRAENQVAQLRSQRRQEMVQGVDSAPLLGSVAE
ncbi:EXS family [Carpediemonas membranifera]|uniref:EXS family n=1 Tax=Carpediemonas membranifera TaxID=201153 RepID=A0A8J6AYD1_9EUKA|nr:EXS family [Carpediemonas membranifera]|eukprot:KAG9395450.1 EXS family [Carpediemonas membranifera]